MRIISQDGTIDLPYEQVVIQRFKTEIYFLNKNLTGVEQLTDDMEIASYSSEAKAQKAMEMLRDAYNNYDFCINLTTENILKAYANTKTKEEFIKYAYPYFQFPKDEDVEV